MDGYTLIHLGILVLLVGGSAFFSGCETAFFSLQRIDIEGMKEQGYKRAYLVDELLSKPRELIISILIGNDFLNIAISAVVASLMAHHLQHLPEIKQSTISTLTSVLILLVFGEITPKIIAVRFNRFYASTAAPLLKLFMKVIAPLKALALYVSGVITRRLGVSERAARPPFDEERLLSVIEQQAEAGIIDDEEETLIKRVLQLDDLPVARIMKPIEKVYMVDEDTPLEQMLANLKQYPFSRVPVRCKKASGETEVCGVVYIKDILRLLNEKRRSGESKLGVAKDLMHPIESVFDDTTADKVLRKMRKKKFHIALVRRRSGVVVGIVTLEDVLEELVGEIYDEKESRRR